MTLAGIFWGMPNFVGIILGFEVRAPVAGKSLSNPLPPTPGLQHFITWLVSSLTHICLVDYSILIYKRVYLSFKGCLVYFFHFYFL